MIIETIAIGDELLDGRLADTNSRTLARALFDKGLSLSRVSCVSDNIDDIAALIKEASGRADIIVTSGGLGPTTDDLTAEAIAQAANEALRFDEGSWKKIEKRFKERGFELPENNKRQAEVPQSAEILENAKGSAPGFLTLVGAAKVFSFPGVPREYTHLVDTHLLPHLKGGHAQKSGEHQIAKTIRTLGITESQLGTVIEPFQKKHTDVWIQYRTSFPENHVRFVIKGKNKKRLNSRANALVNELRDCIGGAAYALGNDTLEAQVVKALSDRGLTLSTAESCTGGLIAKRLTDVSGVSSVFWGSVVSYSNDVKIAQLMVDPKVLEEQGAVCEEVAKQMAVGARINMATDIAVSVTGVAGPNGGTKEKPVGTVCFGISTPQRTIAKTRYFRFPTRSQIRTLSASVALRFILSELGIRFCDEIDS